jgi:hypothetical protein
MYNDSFGNQPIGGPVESPAKAAFSVGGVAGFLYAVLQLFVAAIRASYSWQFVLLGLKWFLYYLVSYLAASKHYSAYKQSPQFQFGIDPPGVRGAGVGAALILCALGWVIAILAAIVVEADRSVWGWVDPIGLFCAVTIDTVLAISLSNLGANPVIKSNMGGGTDSFGSFHD